MPIKKRHTSTGDYKLEDPRISPPLGKMDMYAGSTYDQMGIVPDKAVPSAMHLSSMAANAGNSPLPHEQFTQDLLAQLRLSHNKSDLEDRYRARIRSPLTGVRAFCVTQCQCGGVKAVTECGAVSCPLWALRMGQNGYR